MSESEIRILYVDDEEALGILVPLSMSPLGYRVDYFESARAGLEEFRRRPDDFDAVVTDLSMPEISGFEVARAVLALRPAIPVVVTTGYVGPREEEQAAEAGARAVVLKPDSVDELAVSLDRVIRAALGSGAAV
jgi:CheY-like chemotaxis protein